MNQDTTKWLTKILDKKNLACNQNSIVLDESIMKGIKDLNSCLPNAPELPLKTPNKNFNKAQYYLIKKIFLNLLLIGGIILIWMQLKNLIKSI